MTVAVSADTSHRICEVPAQMVKIRLHNECPHCGKVADTNLEVDNFVAQILLARDKSSNCCSDCAKAIRDERFARDLAANTQVTIDESGIPADFLNWDHQKGNNTLANAIRTNAKKSLFIQGHYATGKSRAACANLKRQIEFGKTGKFVRFGDIANRYARTFSNGETEPDRFIENLLKANFLVIDDLGKRRITQTAGELLFGILDRIYSGESKCRIWITSNIAVRDLASKFDSTDSGDAVVSRIDRMVKDRKMGVITA